MNVAQAKDATDETAEPFYGDEKALAAHSTPQPARPSVASPGVEATQLTAYSDGIIMDEAGDYSEEAGGVLVNVEGRDELLLQGQATELKRATFRKGGCVVEVRIFFLVALALM